MVPPLISADDLLRLLGDGERPPLLDIRWSLGGPPGRDEYRRGHIPGAVFVDLETALAGPPGAGGRHPLPPMDTFAAAMRAAGVRAGAPAVMYDATNGLAAARCWWLLRYAGHQDSRLLDGGLSAWLRAGGQLATGDEPAAAGDFEAHPGGMPLLDAAAAARVGSEGILLDARATERFRGETEPVDAVAGHIPGARSLPTTTLLAGDGTVLPRAELARLFVAAGVNQGASIGVYCGSGVTAAHEVAGLAVAGIEAALYAGSWSEWITDPLRPVATGD